MTENQNTLGYQSAPAGPTAYTEIRRKLFRNAMGNGVCCLILGTIGLVATVFGIANLDKSGAAVFWAIIGTYTAVFFVGGLIYVIGAVKTKGGSLSWHRNIMVMASIHIVAVLGWICLLVWATAKTGNPSIGPFVIAGAIAVALGQMIGMAKKSSDELKFLQHNPPVAPVSRPNF